MYVVLSDEEKERFYVVSKIYLRFLGKDVGLAEQIKDPKEYHSSTAADILKQLAFSTLAKLATKNDTVAKKLAPLVEEVTERDIKDKATFDLLLLKLEKFSKDHMFDLAP